MRERAKRKQAKSRGRSIAKGQIEKTQKTLGRAKTSGSGKARARKTAGGKVHSSKSQTRKMRAKGMATRKPRKSMSEGAAIAVVVSQFEEDLSRSLDIVSLERQISMNPAVGLVMIQRYPSTRSETERVASSVAQHGMSRVVVAGCSERLYGKLYRTMLARCGIDPSMVEFANIRELCVLAFKGSRNDVTTSAVRLVDTAVARLAGAAPMEKIETVIKPVCVVIGGGIAGMSSAAALASRGVKVVLIDKNDALGGLIRRLNIIYPSYIKASEFLDMQTHHMEEGAIEVRTGTEPVSVRGHVGNFEIKLSGGEKLEAGVIIVATGADLLSPKGMFGYGEREQVITQVELEDMLARGENPGSNIVMIQCVGSRSDERPYCSRICCTASIKNAVLIKQKFPVTGVTILSRGFAGYAGDLDRAREMGVDIIRYSPDRPPVIGESAVEVYDQISEMEAHVAFDRVVLAVPMLPPESNRALARMLKIPTDEYGFLVEPRLKVKPEDFIPRGIFVAGCAHWPSTITESIVQGYGAASRAFDLISTGKIERFALVTKVDGEFCRGCGRCEEVCQHGAIDLISDEDGMKRAEVIAIQCVGCGVCVSICPSGALSLGAMSRDLIDMTIEAASGV